MIFFAERPPNLKWSEKFVTTPEVLEVVFMDLTKFRLDLQPCFVFDPGALLISVISNLYKITTVLLCFSFSIKQDVQPSLD